MWGEAARGSSRLGPVGHYEMSFRLACDGIDDVAGDRGPRRCRARRAGGRSVASCGGNTYAKNADIGIFQDEMMVGFFRCGNGDRRLSTERKMRKRKQVASKEAAFILDLRRTQKTHQRKEKMAR